MYNENKLYYLKEVKLENEGWYTCVAKNGFNMSLATAFLTVKEDEGNKKSSY